MAIRSLRLIGDELLAKKSRRVDKIDERILAILEDMADTMYESNGIGLAAVQVGILRSLIVADIGEGIMKLINAEIISREGEESSIEACLSVPGYQGVVIRPEKIVVSYTDENGQSIVLEAQGPLKRVLCHEIDHLDGILYNQIAESFYEATLQAEGEELDESEELGEGEEPEDLEGLEGVEAHGGAGAAQAESGEAVSSADGPGAENASDGELGSDSAEAL